MDRIQQQARRIDSSSWLTTYADVITLLLTFFVLMLTFATSEPEQFQQLRQSIIGRDEPVESQLAGDEGRSAKQPILRYRPLAARRTRTGSEMPPTWSDPAIESVDRGLAALLQPDRLGSAERISAETTVQLLRGSDGKPTSFALQQMRMLAVQLRTQPLDIELQVNRADNAGFGIELARYALETLKVPSGRIAVSIVNDDRRPDDSLRIVMTRGLAVQTADEMDVAQ